MEMFLLPGSHEWSLGRRLRQFGFASLSALLVGFICRIVGRSKMMTIYIKSHCPWCKEAIAWLDQQGYRYEVREVLDDPAAMERMRQLSGQSLTPTMEVDGRVLADFDTGQLSEFLGEHDIKP